MIKRKSKKVKNVSKRFFCFVKIWIDDIIISNIFLSNGHENNWQIASASELLIIVPSYYLIIQSSRNIASILLFEFEVKQSISKFACLIMSNSKWIWSFLRL